MEPRMDKVLIYHFIAHDMELRDKLVAQIAYDDLISGSFSQGYDDSDDPPPPFDRRKFEHQLFTAFNICRVNDINGGAWTKDSMEYYFDKDTISVEFVYAEDGVHCYIWGKHGNTDVYSLFNRHKPKDTIQDEQDHLLSARAELFFKKKSPSDEDLCYHTFKHYSRRVINLFHESITLATLRKPYDIFALGELLAEAKVIHHEGFFSDEKYIDLVNTITEYILDSSISVNVYYHLR